MRRPVLGWLLILVLLAGGLVAGVLVRRESGTGRRVRTFAEPGSRAFIETSLRVILPATATNVTAAEDGEGASYRVLARFDVPPLEFPGVLEQNAMLPAAAELKEDEGSLEAIRVAGDPQTRAWWQPELLQGARCGVRAGRRNRGPGAVAWRVQVCAGEAEGGYTRVYLAMDEEPGAGR
jgi:hypothetical protein